MILLCDTKGTKLSNYLQKRNGIYYFHKRINNDLSDNKNLIRKSLQTKCYTTAKQLASLLNYANKYFSMEIIIYLKSTSIS